MTSRTNSRFETVYSSIKINVGISCCYSEEVRREKNVILVHDFLITGPLEPFYLRQRKCLFHIFLRKSTNESGTTSPSKWFKIKFVWIAKRVCFGCELC